MLYMKFLKALIPLFLIIVVCSAFSLKGKSKGVYVVGVSASFTDSLIYFTDVQFVDSIELKDKMLPYRDQYSDQVKAYLEQVKGLKNRTCFIYFDKKKSKLEKDVKKMKEKYRKEGKSIVREMDSNFKFSKAVAY